MPIQPHDYESLVGRLFDDQLSEAELDRLNDVLRQSPEAREHYWHLVMLEGYLADLPGWIAGQQYATQLAFSETLDAFIEMESNADTELQPYPGVTDPIGESELVTWQDIRSAGQFFLRSLLRQRATWGVAAAAIVCIAALIYAAWFSGGPPQQPGPAITGQQGVVPGQADTPPAPVERIPVAVVRRQFGATADASQQAILAGAELPQGYRIDLRKGAAMQLEYATGVSVILQGPGVYELLSPERVGMQHGQIYASVPPKGKGFTVSTKQTDFIDHGTEFVVTLDEVGRGEVAVLGGLIEAKQAAPRSDRGQADAKSIMIHEGVGGMLAPDEALPQSVEPIGRRRAERYTRSWDDVIYRPRLSGSIRYMPEPPTSLAVGDMISADPLLVPERRAVVLEQALHLNSNKANRTVIERLGLEVGPSTDYVIAEGTKINSFLVHFEIPPGGNQGVVEREFEIEFSGRIIGVVQSFELQSKSDGLVGLASMRYPTDGSLRGASDPPGHPNHDVIQFGEDLKTLKVKMRLTGMDQIRVLVENTDF
ncbi:MAG: hypothetical protein AAF711_06660 [Planctomycetota bacterium]